MEIYLIRHGESIGNTKKGFIPGRTDTDGLTAKGEIELIRLAWELRRVNLTHIFTSPVSRAKESARILGKILRTPVSIRKPLTELDHGIFENHYWWEVADQIPKGWKHRRKLEPEEDFETPYPRGESFRQLTNRVWKFTDQILGNYQTTDKLVIVSHQAILAAISYRLKYGPKRPNPKKFMDYVHRLRLPNGAGLKITIRKDKVIISFLPDPLPPAKLNQSSVRFYIRGALGWTKHLQIRKITTVSQNQVYSIKDRGEAIFKLLSDKESLTIRRLVDLYEYLQTKQVPAPRVLHQDRSRIFFKDDILVQDYLKGVNQNQCIKKHPGKVASLFQDIYKVLTQIHTLKTEEVSSFWYPDDWSSHSHPNWKKYLSTEIGKTLNQLSRLGLSAKVLKSAKDDLTSLKKYIGTSTYRLVPLHGDLSPTNLIIRHRRGRCQLVRFVDFERARIGDPVWDFVYYFGWLERSNQELAKKWRRVVWKNLTSGQKEVFLLYRTLFHAWTARDSLDYSRDRTRANLAYQSRQLLAV